MVYVVSVDGTVVTLWSYVTVNFKFFVAPAASVSLAAIAVPSAYVNVYLTGSVSFNPVIVGAAFNLASIVPALVTSNV